MCLQEAEDDMKKVASVTPKKTRGRPAASPRSRKRPRGRAGGGALRATGVRRTLFQSPFKKKKGAGAAKGSKKADEDEARRGSDSEDDDVFNGNFRIDQSQHARRERHPSQERSPAEEPEEDTDDGAQEEDEEESQRKLDNPRGRESEPDGDHAPDKEVKGFSLEDKIDMVDAHLLDLLTAKCSK